MSHLLHRRLVEKAHERGVDGEIHFISGDITDWLSRPALTDFLYTHGEWMNPPAYRYEKGPDFFCHLSVATRLMATRYSTAWFGFKLYQPGDLSDTISLPTYWVHGWLTEEDGTLLCSSVKSEPSLYYGVKWSPELLRLVRENTGHLFTDLLELVRGNGNIYAELEWV